MKKQKKLQKIKEKMQSVPVYERDDSSPGSGKTLVDADFQMQAAQHAAGVKENTYGVWGPIWKLMVWYDSKRKDHRFKKKTYLWQMLFTGWAGGHRWYQGRRWLGLLETLFFWTATPTVMLVTDFMEVMPIKPDEEGYIVMR